MSTGTLPPPFGVILDALKEGEIIPFLGAGASLGGPPAGEDLPDTLLPTGSGLAEKLGDDVAYPEDREDLAKVASYYQVCAGRRRLRKRLRGLFVQPYRPRPLHRFLADIDKPLMIVTTNYDDLIEQAFDEKKRKYHLVVHPTDLKDQAASVLWWKPGAAEPEAHPPSTLPLSLKDETIIYKMHGSIARGSDKWDSFVITEEDYIDFLSRMSSSSGVIPARFILEFRKRGFLFLGYGMRDWNLRVLLRNLRKEGQAEEDGDGPDPDADEQDVWAIQYNPSELEKVLWSRHQVSIHHCPIGEFVREMRQRMGGPVPAPAGGGV